MLVEKGSNKHLKKRSQNTVFGGIDICCGRPIQHDYWFIEEKNTREVFLVLGFCGD